MHNIPDIINTEDGITKPLGWVLYSIYAIYIMVNYNISFE